MKHLIYFFILFNLIFSTIDIKDKKNSDKPNPIQFGNIQLPKLSMSFESLMPEKNESTHTLLPFQIDEIKSKAKNYVPADITNKDLIVISTNLGIIEFKFYNNESPENCLNFKKLANSKFYDKTLFHHIVPRYIIQGGDILSRNDNPDDDGQGGPGWTVKQEVSSLNHSRGTLSMIRGKDPNSAGSQFFISLSENSNLDGQYTIFAYLVSGDRFLSRISNITTESQQAKMLCTLDIPENENKDDWIEVNDPLTGSTLFSKVPINEKKNNYRIAIQKKLNNIYRPGIPVIIDSIRGIIDND